MAQYPYVAKPTAKDWRVTTYETPNRLLELIKLKRCKINFQQKEQTLKVNQDNFYISHEIIQMILAQMLTIYYNIILYKKKFFTPVIFQGI